VIGRSSQSGSPATGWFTLGTIGQMALTVSGHKCQHYSGSGHTSACTAYFDFGTAAEATRIYTDTFARFLPFILGIATCLIFRQLSPEQKLRLQQYGRPSLLAPVGLVL